MKIDLKGIIEDTFDGVFCVNLDSRADRWKQFQEDLQDYNIHDVVTRFSAVKATPGWVGCKASHMNIIKHAIDNKLNNILIFEDDAEFVDNNMNFLTDSLTQLKTIDWDMLFLGCNVDYPNLNPQLTKVTDNLVSTKFAYTTHAYALNSTVFNRIYNGLTQDNKQIDFFYGHKLIPTIKTFVTNPMMCIQRAGYSDIEKRVVNYDWMLDAFNLNIQ
ncbi:glycosyltransferase family 25 protein [bacterium]|nr:glycosyltransferase family 25 protein [bacterium]